MYTGNLDFANAYRNDFIITKDCENIEKAYELWEYASDPIRALEICNGSHRGVMWDFVDENNEFLPADATYEEIAANNFKYLVYIFEDEEEENAALTAAGYDWLIGKTYTGSNTTGLVNIAPLMLEAENYRTDDLTVWGAQRYVSLDAYDDYLCPYYMNNTIVPPEAQEEFDFMTDGLYNIIKGFFAESVMNGITDESWNAYLNDLETYATTTTSTSTTKRRTTNCKPTATERGVEPALPPLRLSNPKGERERALSPFAGKSYPAACTAGTGRFSRRKIPFSRAKIASLQFPRPENPQDFSGNW